MLNRYQFTGERSDLLYISLHSKFLLLKLRMKCEVYDCIYNNPSCLLYVQKNRPLKQTTFVSWALHSFDVGRSDNPTFKTGPTKPLMIFHIS